MNDEQGGDTAGRMSLDRTAIASVRARNRVAVSGEIISITEARRASSIVCRIEIDDGTGKIALLFFGRHSLPGAEIGKEMAAEGTAMQDGSAVVIWNPIYSFGTKTVPFRRVR